MSNHIAARLEAASIKTSAPCRIDMGGTLDINTFNYPLRHFNPCTFNIALNLRTYITLSAYEKNRVRISSKGFEPAEFAVGKLPFDHPLGLMFAVAAYFDIGGIHIDIHSESPPRSALGGSSVAAVALIAALLKLSDTTLSKHKIALLAHAIEESVAGVPCGLQDQLAAAFGGVHAWYWLRDIEGPELERKEILAPDDYAELQNHLLIAYCGVPHVSKDINGRWVRAFLAGEHRDKWIEIIACTQKFVELLGRRNYKGLYKCMNRETQLRREMTPDVVDDMGEALINEAAECDCGARFTGAGGGGCLWAVGPSEDIDRLRSRWHNILSSRKDACLLSAGIDSHGLRLET